MPNSPESTPKNCTDCQLRNPPWWIGKSFDKLYACPHMPKQGNNGGRPCMNPGSGSVFDLGSGHPRPATQKDSQDKVNERGGRQRHSRGGVRDD